MSEGDECPTVIHIDGDTNNKTKIYSDLLWTMALRGKTHFYVCRNIIQGGPKK